MDQSQQSTPQLQDHSSNKLLFPHLMMKSHHIIRSDSNLSQEQLSILTRRLQALVFTGNTSTLDDSAHHDLYPISASSTGEGNIVHFVNKVPKCFKEK